MGRAPVIGMGRLRETPRRRFRRLQVATGALAVTLLVTACGADREMAEPEDQDSITGTEEQAEGPRQGGRLTMAVSAASTSESLDPLEYTAPPEHYRARAVFDRIAERRDFATELELAESLEAVDGDPSTWRLTLRDGVTFHDGSPLTADDVLWTFERLGRPESPTASFIEPFVDLEATSKQDDLSIEFVLKQPQGDFPGYLADLPFLYVVQDGQDDFSSPEDMVGTGPYRLTEFIPGERFLLAKNEDYWGGEPYIDEIEGISIERSEQLNALLSGEVDVVEEVNFSQVATLEGNEAVQVIELPGAGAPFFTMRMDTEPFDDNRVRKALKYSIDRQQIVDNVYLGHASLGNDMFGKGWPSYNEDVEQYGYDPDRARELLAEAGHDSLEVELVTAIWTDVATLWAEQASAAGITINLNRVPEGDIYNTDLYYLQAPFSETDWRSSSFEKVVPEGLLTDAPYNETAWFRSDWDEEVLAAFSIVDEDERTERYRELHAEIWEEGGYVIPVWFDHIYAASSRVQGIEPTAGLWHLNMARYEELWLTD